MTSKYPLPSYYLHTLANDYQTTNIQLWNFTNFIPDAIVINLGTNDYSTSPQPTQQLFVNGIFFIIFLYFVSIIFIYYLFIYFYCFNCLFLFLLFFISIFIIISIFYFCFIVIFFIIYSNLFILLYFILFLFFSLFQK